MLPPSDHLPSTRERRISRHVRPTIVIAAARILDPGT